MKITMYELLGLVKNGKAPKRFKYDSYIWAYNYESSAYWNGKSIEFEDYMDDGLMKYLNDEVEILEEEKKETKPLTKKDIEALGYACGEIQKSFTNGWTKALENKPLEEEKKIPEKWNDLSFTTMRKKEDSIDDDIHKLKGYIETIMRTQNDVIDYLKSKGDE